MALAIQEALEGKYEILEKIGEGGIGAVYKVRHRLLQEIRVIKVLRPQAAANEDLQERFVHEARMAIRLKQPNIAQLHDFAVTAEGTAYIVMEFIDGVGLDALLRATGPPSAGLALEVSRQALTALGYLHAHRFVHRDVSPDNLMLSRDFEGRPLLKLIDLGIAKNLGGGMQLTATGVFVGKVRYSSPEQFSAQGGGDEIDHRSDIYSFGVLLYELLTGEMPVLGESFSEVAGGHLFHPPRPFDETDPDGRVDGGLREVVLKALEKEPAKRYDSTEAMIAALEPYFVQASELAAEVEERIGQTRAAEPALEPSQQPGSTQNRIDAEFGFATTPTPTLLSEVEDDATVLVTSTRKRGPAAGLGGRWARWAGAAAILAVAAGAAWWALGRGTVEPVTVADSRAREIPAAPPRWGPGAAEGVGLIADQTAPEPPPFPGSADAPESAALSESTPPPPEPRTGQPGPQEPPRGGEGQPPPPGGGALGPPGGRSGGPGGRPPGPPSTTTEIYSAGAVGVVPPVLEKLPPAVFPLDKPPKKDVVFTVTVLVDEFGQPMNPSIKRGPGFSRSRVREAAIEVAMGARFRPAMKRGVAGRMWTDVQIVFPGTE